jgi:hypothetical protein
VKWNTEHRTKAASKERSLEAAFERRDICGPQRELIIRMLIVYIMVGHSPYEHVQSTYVLYVFDSSRFQIDHKIRIIWMFVSCFALVAGILQQRAHTSHFVLVTVTCNPPVRFYDSIQALSSVTL